MDVRPYQPADCEACLAVFDSNLPDYFAPHERAGFAKFLDSLSNSGNGERSTYFVMDHDGTIAGCGGYAIGDHPNSARLTWGMVRRELQRQGLGRFLLLYRLREMTRRHSTIEMVALETTPRSAPFFESQGFRIVSTTPGGYAPGLDRVEMAKRMIVCA